MKSEEDKVEVEVFSINGKACVTIESLLRWISQSGPNVLADKNCTHILSQMFKKLSALKQRIENQ